MFVFPAHIFNPGVVQARIVQNTISGGVALSGDEDVIATDGGGRWEISYSDISLDTPQLLRAWEAWLDYLAGGTVEVLVPILSLETAPRPYLGKHPSGPSELLADDALFPTRVAFAEPYIIAKAASSAPLRATTLAIDVERGAPIEGGEKFEIAGRVYRIGRPDGAGWKISPPLRGPVTSGAALNFDWPLVQCRMRPEDFSVSIAFGQLADGNITFIESFSQ